MTAADVYREGIADVTAADIAGAQGMGCVVKLLAICERGGRSRPGDDASRVRVHPAMIPRRTRWPASRDATTRSSSRARRPAS